MVDIQKIYELMQLKKILKNYKDYNGPADFTMYSPVYLETNEILKEVFKHLDVTNKDVCCVTASGDFALNALALGASSVTTFDINRYAKYILALKIATVKTYHNVSNYEEFMMKASPEFMNYQRFLEVRGSLGGSAYNFWQEFYDYVQKKNISLQLTNFFRSTLLGTSTIQRQYNDFLSEDNYQALRKKLNNVEVKSYDMDITKLPDLKVNHQFDIIYLSNILQYYETIKDLETPKKVHAFLEDVKNRLIRSGGIVGVDYCYWHNLIEFYSTLDSDIRDISNYLILKYPEAYELRAIKHIYPEMEDGLCLTRKL